MNKLLPHILSIFTGEREYFPVEWSKTSLAFNVFRAWECVFWRKSGIKREASAVAWQDSEGKTKVTYAFHSWEALFCFFEEYVRGLIPKTVPIRIHIPMLRTSAGFAVPASPYLFAIAFDTSNFQSTGGNTSLSFAYTVTGTNPYLLSGAGMSNNSDTVNTFTYAGATLSAVQNCTRTNGIVNILGWHKVAPATGSNTLALTRTGSLDIRCYTISYSGVNQSSPVDTSGVGDSSATTTRTVTLTVSGASTWMMAWLANDNGNDSTPGGGTTIRQSDGSGLTIGDSNGNVSGSTTISCSGAGSATGRCVAISFKAAAATVVARGFFMQMLQS